MSLFRSNGTQNKEDFSHWLTWDFTIYKQGNPALFLINQQLSEIQWRIPV